MDKDPETLDMVLDIPNSISLNPFDRPPNIMDDELNSVTPEELEANLSTDCPNDVSNVEKAPAQNNNDMWEQLIQSVLEDTSTQDADINSEQTNTFSEEELKEESISEKHPSFRNIELIQVKNTEEVPVNIVSEDDHVKSNEKEENREKVNKNQEDNDETMSKHLTETNSEIRFVQGELQNEMSVKREVEIMDFTAEEEVLVQCLYDFNVNNDQEDICQVEVYASNREDDLYKKEEEILITDHSKEDAEDDNCSDSSAVSIGYLEPAASNGISYSKGYIKEHQLSTIISDHCYSQDVSIDMSECDVLKQNVINHIIAQNPNNVDYRKISKFVEKILYNLDNNKLEMMLNTLNLEDKAIELEKVKKEEEEIESLSDVQDISNNLIGIVVQDNETTHEIQKSKNKDEGQSVKNESIAEVITEHMQNHTSSKVTEEILRSERKEITENLNEKISNENQSDSSIFPENDILKDSLVNDMKSEHFAENCSEPIEHQIFDEEFELLCKNGLLPLKKDSGIDGVSTELLEKLKGFTSQIQSDCEVFSSSSRNVEEKLLDYIKIQNNVFQELFKPYISFNRSMETQTDSKFLWKRKQKSKKLSKKNNLVNNMSNIACTSSTSSSSTTSSSSDDDEEKNKQSPYKHTDNVKICIENGASDIKSLILESENCSVVTNKCQDYDDGINLSQYVQSEIFDVDSLSPQSSLLSEEDCDSDKQDDNDNDRIVSGLKKPEQILPEDGDSDDTIMFNIQSKKTKKSNDTSSIISSTDAQKSRTNQDDNISVHSESDKENLTSDRKDKKSIESMDEDEKNDREIDRLTNISGLIKRPVSNNSSVKNTDKAKTKVAQSKSLSDRFDFMDVDFGSEDEIKSEAEEEVITEQQFLKNYNENIKRQMLDDSSTGSEATNEEDDALLKTSSEEEDEEGGTKPPLVEKFLKTFVVDDSDNDIEDNDEEDNDDIELDSDKDEEERGDNNESKVEDVISSEIVKSEKTEDSLIDGIEPTKAEMELLNDNFLFRKRTTKPQKLDKMLLDAEKRKNISKIDAELISLSSESSNSDVEAVDAEPNQKPRSLKPMLRPDQLAGETIKAQKLENERISRLEKKHNMLQKILKDHPDVNKNRDLILDYIKETKTFIKVHPGIVKHLKPHQFDGVRFMYDSCYGGVDALKKTPGSGCILAHCMGLGKTLQLIALLHTVISYKELKTTKILVLCPKSTVMNWADEIIRWLGPLRQKNVKVYTFSDTSDINEKLSIIKEWSLSNHTRAGCLLIGYEAFRTLVFYHSYKNRGNISSERLEEIRLLVNKYLLTPGADLVVCDEGHIIKNSNSAISKAVAKIETPRRIVLTGTPIQNNLKEYYSMVNFIKPLFLGTEKEFANLYANPIKNGQHKDSGKTDIKIMKQRSFVLHKKLSKFVQRKEAELLKTFLPTKFEYVLFIPMTDVQNNLYQHILNAIKNRDDTYRGKGLITDYTCLRKIWTHPKVLEDAWKNAISQRNKKEIRNKLMAHNSDDDQPDDIYDSQTGQMSVTNDWWRHLVKECDLESVMPSNKLRTMFNILQMCEEKGEKCLIFSAFVAVLNVVEYFFKKITDNDTAIIKELNINRNSKWVLGQDYYRLDGKTPKSIRHAMINEFNNIENKMARVFLISAKAGGQGINLIGANRVIILDTSWNPSNDQQNIFRVFRLGQKRSCYIYRLLAMGTMEEKVYSRSVTKQAMSFRVVDVQQIDRHYNMAELAELYTLTFPDKKNRPTPILPQDSILARLLRNFPDLVYKYHEHDSLLENKVEQELSEQEKNEAWTAYERDLQMSSEIREMPNMEDFQNKFNASNLQNYLSPFSGLDVSNIQNANNSKNMSHLLSYNRGFGPTFLQSLLGQNTNAALNTQQYIDMYNYYKNLGSTYADMNAYGSMPGMGGAAAGLRMPPSSVASSMTANPLAALGDLSMFGLNSTALQGLGANPSALNLPSSLSNSSAALQQMSNSASMYTSASALNPNLPISSVGNLTSAASTSSNSPAAVLSAYEQYKQSLRGSYNNMYNYTGDFGLSSSGSTILDNSKSKSIKASGTNNKTTNLPGGSKGGSTMGLFPATSSYLSQQHQTQQRPSSKDTPSYELPQIQQQQQLQQQQQQQKFKSDKFLSKSLSANSSTINSTDSTSTGRANSLISYRKSETTAPSAGVTNSGKESENTTNKSNVSVQQNKPVENIGSSKTTPSQHSKNVGTTANNATNLLSNQKISQKTSSYQSITSSSPVNNTAKKSQSLNIGNNATKGSSSTIGSSSSTTSSNSTISGSSITISNSTTGTASKFSAQAESNRASNMGILYPNSKGGDKSGTKPNSPLNMGIVYPKSSSKSTSSEMQIIPTSSPPGTTSISKQLNELSPSISLTALKSNAPNKTQKSLNVKSTNNSSNSLNTNINKIIQGNNNLRRTTSPINSSATTINKSSSSSNLNTSNSTSLPPTMSDTSNQNNMLTRIKMSNNKKTHNANSNSPVPPLHRASSLGNITPAITTKTTTGLTITNVKNPMQKNLNVSTKPSSTNQQQVSTLAKQTAAAAVVKSNINRLSSANNNSVTSSPSNSSTLPSLTSIKRIVKRNSPSINTQNKMPALTASPSLTVTASNKLPIISSVKSISQSPSSMATLTKTSLTKINSPQTSNNASLTSKSPSSSTMGSNLPSVQNISKTLAQLQKRLPKSQSTPSTSTSSSSVNTTKNTVNIRPVDANQNPAGNGVYIIETNINDKKLAIGTPTKSGGGTTVTKVPTQSTTIKRKATDPLSKDKNFESKRLKN